MFNNLANFDDIHRGSVVVIIPSRLKNVQRGALRNSGLYLDDYCISKTFTSGQCINITKKTTALQPLIISI